MDGLSKVNSGTRTASDIAAELCAAASALCEHVRGLGVASEELPSRDALSLLRFKNDTMSLYLANLCHLARVKLMGGSLKDAAVVERLVEYRAVLEQGIAPLEKRLRPQIDQMLQRRDDANAAALEPERLTANPDNLEVTDDSEDEAFNADEVVDNDILDELQSDDGSEEAFGNGDLQSAKRRVIERGSDEWSSNGSATDEERVDKVQETKMHLGYDEDDEEEEEILQREEMAAVAKKARGSRGRGRGRHGANSRPFNQKKRARKW